MISQAKKQNTISYSELVDQLTTIDLEAHDTRLGTLLGEISTREDNEGRGMLSVIVVHKTGDMQPGPGFFELASELGRDTSDIEECWIEELNNVFDYWSAATVPDSFHKTNPINAFRGIFGLKRATT